MNTVVLLMAQFGPKVAIPLEDVRREYFPNIAMDTFMRKIALGDIPLPITRPEKSQKAAKFIGMMDLAIYLDTQMELGRKEYEAMKAAAGSGPGANQRFADLMFKRR